MWKHIASNALTLAIVVAVVLAGLVTWARQSYLDRGPLTQAAFFEVERGDTLRRVSDRLEAAGVVSSAALFRVGAEYAERSGDLKFGNYEIPAGASMEDVLDIVTAGGPSTFRYTATLVIRGRGAEVRVRERVPGSDEIRDIARFAAGEALPEAYSALVEAGTPMVHRVAAAPGLTSWQIVEGLRAADFLRGEIGVVPAEGSLSPDTYEVSRGTERQEILDRMAAVQERTLAEVWETRAEGLPFSTPEEALTLASIIEKETGVGGERGLVSAVFVNRLNQGMRLQTDPTVIYGITNGEGILGRGLRRSELRAPTPYNTYVIEGLPPGPIANPGRAALEAAVNPVESDFIFFVADGSGGHAFAVTLSEHNQNVAAWRAIEAARGAASE